MAYEDVVEQKEYNRITFHVVQRILASKHIDAIAKAVRTRIKQWEREEQEAHAKRMGDIYDEVMGDGQG